MVWIFLFIWQVIWKAVFSLVIIKSFCDFLLFLFNFDHSCLALGREEYVFSLRLRDVLCGVSYRCNSSSLTLPIVDSLSFKLDSLVLFQLINVTFVPLVVVTANFWSLMLHLYLALGSLSNWRLFVSWSYWKSFFSLLSLLLFAFWRDLKAWNGTFSERLGRRSFFLGSTSFIESSHLARNSAKLIWLSIGYSGVTFAGFKRRRSLFRDVGFQRVGHLGQLFSQKSWFEKQLLLLRTLLLKDLIQKLLLLFCRLGSLHVLVYYSKGVLKTVDDVGNLWICERVRFLVRTLVFSLLLYCSEFRSSWRRSLLHIVSKWLFWRL